MHKIPHLNVGQFKLADRHSVTDRNWSWIDPQVKMEADECSFSVLNGVTRSYCSGSFLCVLVVGTDIHPNLACLYTAHECQ